MAPRKCFFGCEGKLTLFSFPKEASARQKWIEWLFPGQQKKNTYAFVCLRHFTRDCFVNMGQYEAGLAGKLLLKDDAFPTLLGRAEESKEQASTSQQILTSPRHRHMGCQTESASTESRETQFSPHMVSVGTKMLLYPSTKSVATQLAYGTLKQHVRSKGTQATVSNQNGFAPLQGVRPAKRPRLECEESEDEDEDEEEETIVPHDSTNEPSDSITEPSEIRYHSKRRRDDRPNTAANQPAHSETPEQECSVAHGPGACVKSCVNIGEALQRWGDLRELKSLKTDTEVAVFLLDSYDKLCALLMTTTGTCKQEPAAQSRLKGVATESFEKMEVTIEDDQCHSVKSDPDGDTENATERTELSAPGANDSCDGDVCVPVIPQRSETSEFKLECKEEELESWQKHTLIVHFKEEDDVGELGDDQTDCKPDPSSLQSWAAGQHTLKTEACAVAHTSEGHQISNNPVSLSSVQSPEVYAPSSNKLQSDQSDSQTLSVPFPSLCLTVIKVEPAET